MKRKTPTPPNARINDRGAVPDRLSARRRWWFRIVALSAIPCALLAAELLLRWSGFGYVPGFFREILREGRAVAVPNDRFGQRFFPAQMARSPTPWGIDVAKPAGAYRIFLFGESAALGDPRPAFGMARYLKALMEERHPGTTFEVVPAAMTAINSHAVREIAWDARRYNADLWIVYTGNNEMAGPFGAVSVFGARAPSFAWIRSMLALKSFRVGQALVGLSEAWFASKSTQAGWRGLGMFAGQSLPPDDPSRARVHDHFRRNLQSIVEAAETRGLPILLCTVASNLRDCAPFASVHRAGLAKDVQERWDRLVASGDANLAAKRPAEASTNFAEARVLDGRNAALRYREGRCAILQTNYAAAREHFTAARDLDALPFRADSTINGIVRDVAASRRAQGAGLVDVEHALAAAEPPGLNLFLDHVHLTFDGNFRVARELAAAVEERLPQSLKGGSPADWVTQERAEQRLALSDWNRHGAYEAMFQRCQEAPFTDQLNHAEHLAGLRARMMEYRERMHPRVWLETGDLYRDAIARSPRDPQLYEAQAEFFEATRQSAEAVAAWRKVAELLPEHAAAWYNIGRLLARNGGLKEAQEAFQRCLAVRPGEIEALLEMGRLLTVQSNHVQAVSMFQDLRKRFPGDARVLRHLADPLAALGKRAEAVDCLRQAAQLRPGYWEARYLYGVELAMDEKVLDAAKEFDAVIRVRPDHILARLNLGVAMVRLGQVDGARRQFNEVLRQDPQNTRARQHLEALDQLLQQVTNAPPKVPAR